MFEVQRLSAAYGLHRALDEARLRVGEHEVVVMLGANGAGKTTLLKAIAGLVASAPATRIELAGQPLQALPARLRVEAGIALVPEGRGIFGELTVRENLALGAYPRRARAAEAHNLERVLALFPRLAERLSQTARTMSGGEQQMVAIGRALMSAPRLLLLDEPSLGLAPLMCLELFRALKQVRATGVSILLVEQNAKRSLAIADRGYLLENGRIAGEGSAAQLLADPAVQAAYLGGGEA
ncbi:MAG: ABC transporter ATP-binding protein [Rubrivivax sp. SCN 71-131]|jgi:branched-chain amino acid transport system ATP-binding protein|nr:MAG: ABC transporter ATP-binding protein [Rubrivivax sp. SCN 71-131]